MTNQADQTYLGLPTLTAFTLMRSRTKVVQQYQNNQGAQMQQIETRPRMFKATMTVFQPVYEIVDGNPVVVRYLDLGDDEFEFAGTPEKDSDKEAGVVYMEDVIDASVVASLRDVLISIVSAQVPDFAAQAPEFQAVAVARYFHIDAIRFAGRFDKPKEACLTVGFGVYEDEDCTIIKKVVEQDFFTDSYIAAKKNEIDTVQGQLDALAVQKTNLENELKQVGTTEERKQYVTAELPRVRNEIERVTAGLANARKDAEGLVSINTVIDDPDVAGVVQSITKAVLTHAKAKRKPYFGITVEALMAKFPAAFAGLKAVIKG